MRRSLFVLVATAALIGSSMVPAQATTPLIVMKALGVDEATFGSAPHDENARCAQALGTQQYNADLTIQSTPLDPNVPSSHRTWGFTFWQYGTESDAYGLPVYFGAANDLATLSIDSYDATSGYISVDFYENKTDSSEWLGKAPIAGTSGAWATSTIGTTPLTWTEYNAQGVATGATETTTMSVAAFAAKHGEAPGGWVGMIGFGCDGHGFRIQNLQFGQEGAPYALDLESLTNTVWIQQSAKKIKKGSRVTLRGTAQYGSGSVALLQQKPSGKSSWSTVASAHVDSDGTVYPVDCNQANTVCRDTIAAVNVRPKRTTMYRWYYPGTVQVDAAYSPPIKVTVR